MLKCNNCGGTSFAPTVTSDCDDIIFTYRCLTCGTETIVTRKRDVKDFSFKEISDKIIHSKDENAILLLELITRVSNKLDQLGMDISYSNNER